MNALVDIAAKKIPSDVTYTNKVLDSIYAKLKLVAVPKNVVD